MTFISKNATKYFLGFQKITVIWFHTLDEIRVGYAILSIFLKKGQEWWEIDSVPMISGENSRI